MLSGKKAKYLQMLLEAKQTKKAMAEALNVSRNTLTNWEKDEEFRAEYNESVRREMNYTGSRAYRKMVSLLNSRNDNVALGAAKDLMDRAGFKPEESVKMDIMLPVIFEGEQELKE